MDKPKEKFQIYQNVFNDFITKKDKMVNSLSCNVDDNQTKIHAYKSLLVQKENYIRNLKKKIDKWTLAEKANKEVTNDMKTTIKELRNYAGDLEKKHQDLETKYEKKLAIKQKEISDLKNTIASLQLKHSDFEKKIASQLAEMDKLNKKYIKEVTQLVTSNTDLVKQLNDACIELENTQKEFNSFRVEEKVRFEKQRLENQREMIMYENDVKNLKDELSKVQAKLVECETNKNKIIEEQRFKIREIERALENPVLSVAANNTTKKTVGVAKSIPQEVIIQLSDTEKTPNTLPKYSTRKRRQLLSQATKKPLVNKLRKINSTSTDDTDEDTYFLNKFKSTAYNFALRKEDQQVEKSKEKPSSNEITFDLIKNSTTRLPLKEKHNQLQADK
ncbi:testis-specific gene 10 protein-like [Teleopsis dalmanni]|uniref:testis-specific gene 10 protein-like n=1 Tax=Teleopsis dalmanni TaxID=139649 RepID=UPI0018CE251B|nr:testis-specific gene 10 protein-like [Teleopsis dalmanni]